MCVGAVLCLMLLTLRPGGEVLLGAFDRAEVLRLAEDARGSPDVFGTSVSFSPFFGIGRKTNQIPLPISIAQTPNHADLHNNPKMWEGNHFNGAKTNSLLPPHKNRTSATSEESRAALARF